MLIPTQLGWVGRGTNRAGGSATATLLGGLDGRVAVDGDPLLILAACGWMDNTNRFRNCSFLTREPFQTMTFGFEESSRI